ncbi:MAG: 16S rRNA (uracil(1498)-N(3))-methyltransferase [Coriobacteriia bacterium]|nr:16S rRNA (uracil(1498)-N(3))-methyltransferase [Coriobacteriia bacterium]
MSRHRFFLTAGLDPAKPSPLPVSAADLHHARNVLRLRPGQEIEVVGVVEPESAGRAKHIVRVSGFAPIGMLVSYISPLPDEAPEHPRLTLVQGVAKGERMDLVMRQATELGVDAIWPVVTARTIVRMDEGRRAEKGARWRRIAKAAAEQSHGDSVPDVRDPVDLCTILDALADFDLVVVAWEDADARSVPGVHQVFEESGLAAGGLPHGLVVQAAVVIGPEGGLEGAEVDALQRAGGVIASLGTRILRTETAAVVAVTLAKHALGRAFGVLGS